MRVERHSTRAGWMPVAFALCCALTMAAPAQVEQPGSAPEPQNVAPTTATEAAGQGVVLDRVIAVVNGDLILESDVDEERRFEEIQPFREERGDVPRVRVIQRLVNRMLIRQQAALEPEAAVSDKEVDPQIEALRKNIAECRQYHCETEDGWKNFLGKHGFTPEEFRERWRQRMELLKFIEIRFRNGITITDDQINTYYQKIMLPEYAKQHVNPPSVDSISKRIQEVLLQQQVNALLADWLKSLRAEGSVRLMTPGEAAP